LDKMYIEKYKELEAQGKIFKWGGIDPTA
jgi:hypothetical protein